MQHNNLPGLFREDLESLIIFMMLGGIGQLGVGGRMWKDWPIYFPDGLSLDEVVAEEAALTTNPGRGESSPISMFKCDGCGLLQMNLGFCEFCGDRGTSSTHHGLTRMRH